MALIVPFLLLVAVGVFLFIILRSHSNGHSRVDDDVFEVVSAECVRGDAGFQEPKNETEFREIFERVAGPLFGYRVSVSQTRCPDLLLYDKNKKETVRAEVEYKASDFFRHRHKFDSVDLIVCWVNDLKKSHIPVLECRKRIMEGGGSP